MSYCVYCGKKNLREPNGWHDPKTGKKKYREVCPDACKHGQHDWTLRDDLTIWGKLFRVVGNERCRKCGVIGDDYSYLMEDGY